MNRKASGLFTLIPGLVLAGAAGAHHPPQMDHCYSVTFTAQVERVEWRNPHVQIVVRTDDGESRVLTWLNVQQLGWAGIERDTLAIGDHVTVTVGTQEEIQEQPLLLAAITRTSDGWAWSQTPQGC